MSNPAPVEPRAPATRRILDAARDLVAQGGAAQLSMGDVAARAGVSKALVHYHFTDKDSLVSALVEEVGRGIVDRERAAVTAGDAGHALDVYWQWLEGELHTGDAQILTALSEYDSERVRMLSRRVATDRRAVAVDHVSRVFESLSLAPRVPAALVAETIVAFIDGLAMAYALDPTRDPRPAFDVLWLALITLSDT
jgi:AcrR family transcriptional regulator